MSRAQRLRDGDADFTRFYRQLHPQAFRVARRLLGDPTAAEDATSEGFARTYARWSRVRDLPYRDAWTLRVVANVALDLLARKTPLISPQEVAAQDDAVAARLALVDALRRLPRRQREAVVLRHLAGYSEVDTARVLGVAPGTVKTHLQRGMAALRADLRGEAEDELPAAPPDQPGPQVTA